VTERVPLSAPDITEAEIAAVAAVLRTPHLCLGPELAEFETEMAAFHSIEHAVAVSSGTAGLHLALVSLGVGAGDEVIIPSFAFVAVANAVLQVSARPVFAEIDAVTLNLDPAAVDRAVTSRTRAIVGVHTFGVPAEMDALTALARRRNLALIEDASEALGAQFDGRTVGGFGDVSVFGFYPNKQMTTGEGGMVLTRNAATAARLRKLRNQGRESAPGAGAVWLDWVEPGYNYRLSDLASALGRVQLRRLGEMLALRREAASRYDALLKQIRELERPALTLPRREISWFVYVVRLPQASDRDAVRRELAGKGIATGRYFAPLHLQPCSLQQTGGQTEPMPVTESVAERTLALPFFNRITAGQQQKVVEALHAAIASGTGRGT